jgi:2-dehydro-3-deoxyphosphogluconate aldolase/(4S)-4-hydroxy-2-oxoglutarate aldolase
MKLQAPVIGILRGVDPGFFRDIMDASFDGGLDALEITMNTPNASEILAENLPRVPKGKYLGMGTICCLSDAEKAAGAGAMFFVTPNLDTRVIDFANKRGIPVIAGALTPTEVYSAWAAGAFMVKVFPCGLYGPGYIKDLRGPFDRIPLAAVGGVTEGNVSDYFKAGADAVGVGTSLFGKKAMESRCAAEISGNVRRFINACRK